MEPHLVLMPVSDLPGVGWSLSHRLTDMGISTVADLRERSSAALQRDLGAKTGQTLWNFAHGRWVWQQAGVLTAALFHWGHASLASCIFGQEATTLAGWY